MLVNDVFTFVVVPSVTFPPAMLVGVFTTLSLFAVPLAPSCSALELSIELNPLCLSVPFACSQRRSRFYQPCTSASATSEEFQSVEGGNHEHHSVVSIFLRTNEFQVSASGGPQLDLTVVPTLHKSNVFSLLFMFNGHAASMIHVSAIRPPHSAKFLVWSMATMTATT